MPARASRPSAYAFRCTSSYLIERHRRSMKMLSKRAEDALRASEASLLDAQRLTRTCSWRHEVLSDKVTVSPEGLLMYGIEPEDDASSADFYFGRMHPKNRPGVQQAYAPALLRKIDF